MIPLGKGSRPSADARWTKMTLPSLATRRLVIVYFWTKITFEFNVL